MNDMMLDFETLATEPDALVLQIGACFFDRLTGEIGRTFKMNVDSESSAKYGFVTEPSTALWWMAQSKDAIKSVTEEPRIDVRTAFLALNEFIQGARHIWSHSTFDFVILTQAMKRLNIKPMFNYKSSKDIRTLTHLAKLDAAFSIDRKGIHHDALDDCRFQVQYCVACLNKLSNKLVL